MERKVPQLVSAVIVFVTIATASAQNSAPRVPRISAPATQGISRPLWNLPIAFEPNLGQIRGDSKFISRGPGYSAFLTAQGMVLSLSPRSTSSHETLVAPSYRTSKDRALIQFNLLGAAANPVVVGELPLPGRVNYFIGKDPRRWHRDVPTYGRVRYKAVYPGIDLVYYGSARTLEYDFEVSAGADPNLIRFEIQGANQIDLAANGDLVVKTSAAQVRFQCPIVYQTSDGHRIQIEGGYVLNDPTHVSFRVARYDSSKSLIIDPVLIYSTYFGGNGSDEAHGIAVDGSGAIYLAGDTDSTDLPGMSQLPSLPGVSAFVAKFDPTGSKLIYEDYWGGLDGDNLAYALALDAAESVYVTGTTSADDFPTTPNGYQNTLKGNQTGFLTKISADGSSLLYSTYFGGSSFDWPSSIALDSLGDVYIAGSTSSQDFPTLNAYQSSMLPNQNGQYGFYGFVIKFSPDLSALAYSTYLGGNSNVPLNCGTGPCWFAPVNYIHGLAVDPAGDAYVAGITVADNFPVTSGAYLAAASSENNAAGVGFISKLNASGGLDYSTYLYGSGGAQTDIEAITIDSSGSAYVTGQTLSDGTFPITTTTICDPAVYGANCGYAFVTKLDPTGSTLAYSTFLGPNNLAAGYAITLDSSNNAYVLSMTQSGSYATVNGLQSFQDITTTDLLLAEIDSAASTQLFSTYLGGSTGNEYPAGIVLDASGNIYVGGETFSSDFPTTIGAFQSALNVAPDAFVLKIAPTAAAAIAASPATLEYASQPISSTSPVKTTLLKNMGNAPLVISSISTRGDFSESDNCGTSVSAASDCIISVSFAPTGPGERTGSVAIQSNAVGASPQLLPLYGYASGPWAAVDRSSLTFPGTPIGSSSQVATVKLTNSGDSGLAISGIQVSADFAQTNSCPAMLAAGSSCNIGVKFTPAVSGTRTGTLAVLSNAAGSPLSLSLSGEGSDFSLHSSQPQSTVSAGGIAIFSVNLSPLGGAFNNTIQLTCSGQPADSLCRITPSLTVPGSNPVTLLVSVNTTGARATVLPTGSRRGFTAMLLNLEALGLIVVVITGSWRKKLARVGVAGVATLVFLITWGCAVPTRTAPPQAVLAPGVYSISITGSSGTLQHSIPLTLIVQ